MSLKEFRGDFQQKLVDIHWRQWTALGAASRYEEERKRLVDLEALLCSTLCLADVEKRLLSIWVEWVHGNTGRPNESRFKRIAKLFTKKDKILKKSLLDPSAAQDASQILNFFGKERIAVDGKGKGLTVLLHREWKRVTGTAYKQKKIAELNTQKPSLLQLRLRDIFGVNARAEVMLYLLLLKREGSSLGIAKEISFDQKIVYRILERWVDAGLAVKTKGRTYVASDLSKIRDFLGFHDLPVYTNWSAKFHLFARIHKALLTKPWSDDEYLMSSFFRDILDEADQAGRPQGIKFPEARAHEGKEYFEPFAKKLMKLLR